jgi:small subunit ribosomal protein S16
MVKIRLRRVGAKKQPYYRVVVTDSKSPRDGKFLETIGHYNPRTDPPTVEIDDKRALHWLSLGAQPSEAVRQMLDRSGILARAAAIKRGEVLPEPARDLAFAGELEALTGPAEAAEPMALEPDLDFLGAATAGLDEEEEAALDEMEPLGAAEIEEEEDEFEEDLFDEEDEADELDDWEPESSASEESEDYEDDWELDIEEDDDVDDDQPFEDDDD